MPAGKKVTLLNADGSEQDYTLNYLTFDQEQELLGVNPPPPVEQRRKLLAYSLGIEEGAVGSMPGPHTKALFDQILVLGTYVTPKGADGKTSGEAPTTKPSEPS